jgi:hypothetical protein
VLLALASALLLTASGAHGKVLIDPARPVCAIDQPCSAPDANEQLAFWRGTRRVATATTGSDGTFRVALAAGVYRVTLPHRRPLRARIAPVEIRIPKGRDIRVVFRVDIGIR